jgi:hypothetical protein
MKLIAAYLITIAVCDDRHLHGNATVAPPVHRRHRRAKHHRV